MKDNKLSRWAVWIVIFGGFVGLLTKATAGDDLAANLRSLPSANPPGRIKPAAAQDGICLFFSPNGNCTQAVIEQIANAQKTLKVQAYYVTSAPIAKAVVDAKNRGVEVTVVLDKSQQTAAYSSATFFANAGIPTHIDAHHAIAHNKIILIDDKTIITGSFNFTRAAEESNAENLLILSDKPELMAAYQQNFSEHLKHSIAYRGLDAGKENGRSEAGKKGNQETKDAPRAGDEVMVHATKSGTKYHLAGCRSLARSDIPMTLIEARGKGLTPCAICQPPE
jgi:phosphatidylserine/phosphatidylglycerophosphate/cardiolipin synthase-like enzyme